MTKKDLERAVDNLNDSYMKREKNEFQVTGAYGGWKIVLTGKSKKVGGKWVFYGIGSGSANLTSGYNSATETLAQLGVMLSDKEAIKRFIKRYSK